MPELKIYTVKDLREWLENNHPAAGLSERVIAPTRAWAIIHNPYVKDEDAIVAAIFEDGELAAYTASFPDMLDGKRVWWASTLYCYPKFTGKGYGLIVVGSLMEAHELDLTYDRWGANETVEIFNHLGYKTNYTPRFYLSDKKIDKTTIKGKLAACVQSIKKCMHPWPKQSGADYKLRYTSYIDGEAYAFMMAHRGSDLWLREQGMLNWILRYPLKQSCPLFDRMAEDIQFSANTQSFHYMVVKVYSSDILQGVYILRNYDDTLGVVCLYYSTEHKDTIYASVVDHILAIRPIAFVTENEDLWKYVREHIYFPKSHRESISLTLPHMPDMKQYSLQMGDGDSFA